jgi:hypothetical protein
MDHDDRDAVSGLVNGGGAAEAPPGGAGSGEADPNLYDLDALLQPSHLIFGLVVPTSGGGTTCIPICTDDGGRLHGATADAALRQLDAQPDALHNRELGRRRVVGLCRPPFGKDVNPWKGSRSTISWPHPSKGRTLVQTSDFVCMDVRAGQQTRPLTLDDIGRFKDTTHRVKPDRSDPATRILEPSRNFRLVWTCTACTESVVKQPEIQRCINCRPAAAAVSNSGAAAIAGSKCLCLTSWLSVAGRRTEVAKARRIEWMSVYSCS